MSAKIKKNFNVNTDNSESWLTPKYIIDALGGFDLDPCCPSDMPWSTAKTMVSLPTDGLTVDWNNKRVWLNPPYGRKTFEWLDKLSKTKSGIALIFARTETKGFKETIWDRADAIAFIHKRLTFHRPDGSTESTANAPSCLVSYSKFDTDKLREAIERGDIDAKLVFLNNE